MLSVRWITPWRASAPARAIGNLAGQRLRSESVRDEVCMLAQTIAGAFDMHDDGVVEQSVEKRGGDDGITKNLAPFAETAV